LYEPTATPAVVTFNVELPAPLEDRVTVDGLRLTEGPDGETRADRLIVPEKLLRLARLIVEVPEDPWVMVKDAGFAEILKSGVDGGLTVTDTLAEWLRELLLPVTVTL
jgi:hypothetical protein